MEISIFPLDITFKIVDEKALIYIYGRNQDNEQLCLIDSNFEPYFYLQLEEGVDANAFAQNIKGKVYTNKNKTGKVNDVKIQTKVLGNKEIQILKVFTDLPGSISPVSFQLKESTDVARTYEYDIAFTRRYCLDKGITPMTLCKAQAEQMLENSRVPCFKLNSIEQVDNTTYTSPSMIAFDIETYNPNQQMSNPEYHPIVQLSMYSPGFEKVITWKTVEGYGPSVEVVENEEALLKQFAHYINLRKPDIITGYFSDGFDFPYILKRAHKHKIKLDINLDYSKPNLAKGNQTAVEARGIIHLDILQFIRRVVRLNLKTDSLKLDAVANELLGAQKDEIDIENLATYWDNSDPKLAKFAKYCLKDSQLTYDIARLLMPNVIEFVKLIGQPITSIIKMRFAQFVEWYLMRRAQELNMIIPNKPGRNALFERQGVQVEGAFVFEPIPGKYDDVVVFDFRSLYPSIIVAHNISPETLNVESEHKEIVPDHPNLFFTTDKDGFFSTILEEIMNRRSRIKAMMKTADEKKKPLLDARQNSLKILLNSTYGYLGFAAARWYSKECAAAVTAYGRHHIHDVIDKSNAAGFKVIYSDTDSIFITLEGKSQEDALSFVDKINLDLPEMMELEAEGYFKSALFVKAKGEEGGAKKRYALCDEEGNITIKGFESVRRNTSFIAKEIQREVIRLLLNKNDIEGARTFVKDAIKNLRDKKTPNDKMIIITQLTKPIDEYSSRGPHVVAAQQMIDSGVQVTPGMRIQYIVGPGKGKIGDRVKIPQKTAQGEYDADYYIENQIIPAIQNIFEEFDVDIEKETDGKNQSSLSAFF